MTISSLLFFFVAKERWHWKVWQAGALTIIFLSVELAFLGANAVKFLHGAWLPLVMGAAMFAAMSTWKLGRSILAEVFAKGAFPMDLFIAELRRSPPVRVPGTAVFMSASRTGVPPVLLHHLKHNKVLHNQVVLLSFITEDVPHVREQDRLEMAELGEGLFRVSGHYGFMEKPVAPELLLQAETRGLKFAMADTSFYLGRETLIPSSKHKMTRWRKKLFSLMHRNAQSATAFFEIPANRVVELGAQIEM
jgi:KUP system potassium uptake protein